MKRVIILIVCVCVMSAACVLLASSKGGSETVQGIGVLVRNVPLGMHNPSEYKLEDGYLYSGTDYRISGTNIVYKGSGDLQPLAGKVVLYTYTREMSMADLLKKKGPAPEKYGEQESMQSIRSDWTAAETGFSIGQSTRARLESIPYFAVQDISVFEGLLVQSRGSVAEVYFTNTLPVEIRDLTLFAHYESQNGRPVSRFLHESPVSLKPGEKAKAEFESILQEEERLHFALYTVGVELVIGGQPSRFEIALR